jgi:NAD(P)H-flavin reductase
MAVARLATVASAELLGPDTRVLTLEMGEPLGFSGGQYIIVDSGLVAPSGKAIKRAYSLLSADSEQTRFMLASKHLPPGPGSGYIHTLPVGAQVKFSGPWGKMVPAEDASGRTLVLATDTGISAALGLVRGRRFAPLITSTRFLWLRPDPAYFLPDATVRACLPPGLTVEIGTLPPAGHPERVPFVQALVRGELAPLQQAFIAGDGLINYALLADLVAVEVPATRDNVESFFNMPKKVEGA